MNLNESEFREKVYACLLGKAIGGTLGMPFEGYRHTLELTYYDPVPTGMVANDDLDLQVIHAWLLDRMPQPRVDRHELCKAWDHLLARPDEYGIVKRNLGLGLVPPATGAYDNWFYGGMGAAIRTELWASLAAGDPDLAAAYSYEDACMDHAGEGIDAAQFIAALEALAFIEDDVNRLLDESLARIPVDSQVRRAVELTRKWFGDGKDWQDIRAAVMEAFGNDNFTWVVPNMAFIVLGLLTWQKTGDYGRALCVAVGCGEDTDCTGATLGSILGILRPREIPERWRKPLGDQVVLSRCVRGVTAPKTLGAMTDLILSLRKRIGGQPPREYPAVPMSPKTGILAEFASLPWRNAFPPHQSPPPVEQSAWKRRVLPGTWSTLERNSLKEDMLIVKYPLHFSRKMDTLVMVNTPHWVRVWADGKLLFARDEGEMAPSFHRVPIHQMAQAAFSAGDHELIVAMMPAPGAPKIEWVAALAEQPEEGRLYENWLVRDGFVRAEPEA